MLTMADHVPAVIDTFTAGRGATGIVKTGKLAKGTTLSVEANIDGKVTISPAPHCKDMVPPASCVLAAGSYTVDFVAPTGRATHNVVLKKAMTEKFEFGNVDAGEGKTLQIAGQKLKHATLETGVRTVNVLDENGSHPAQVHVKAGSTVVAD
jgi:plastocyanin